MDTQYIKDDTTREQVSAEFNERLAAINAEHKGLAEQSAQLAKALQDTQNRMTQLSGEAAGLYNMREKLCGPMSVEDLTKIGISVESGAGEGGISE